MIMMMKRTLAFLILSLCLLTGRPAKADEAAPASVPFEILKTKHLAVQIKVNGKGPYRVIFDTGAPVTLLNNRIAKDAGLISGKASAAFFGMQGQKTVKLLELGDLKAENVPVIVMDHPLLKVVSEVLGPLDGIVGFPFFARYRMTMDYQAMKMTFVPTTYKPADVMDSMMLMMTAGNRQKPPKKVLTASTVWGLVVDKEEGDKEPGVKVTQVMIGGAADLAGIQKGDRLLVLDSVWTDSVVDCYRAAGGVQPTQTVQAKLKRGDQEVEVSISPRAGL